MTTLPSHTDWRIADVLSRPQYVFVLWMIQENICSSIEDFTTSFEMDADIQILVDSLEAQGLLVKSDHKLTLTQLARNALARLTEHELIARASYLQQAYNSDEQLAMLLRDVDGWNRWKRKHPFVRIDFSAVDLSGANLRKANLSRINLHGANMRGANLSSANLDETDLSRADLSGAILEGANLAGADMTRAILYGAYMSGLFLREARLSGADLRGASLFWTDMQGADLRGANLSGLDLSQTNLSDADLSGADMSRYEQNEADQNHLSLYSRETDQN